jgi:dCTP deaminase
MVLSDRDIKAYIKEKKIVITPLPDFKTQLGTCSLDLRLGNKFRVFDHSKNPYLDPTKKDYTNEITS